MLVEIHPCRAAGRHDRQFDVLVSAKESLEPVEDFGPFFHDGKVCAEVGVKDIVKAKGP